MEWLLIIYLVGVLIHAFYFLFVDKTASFPFAVVVSVFYPIIFGLLILFGVVMSIIAFLTYLIAMLVSLPEGDRKDG